MNAFRTPYPHRLGSIPFRSPIPLTRHSHGARPSRAARCGQVAACVAVFGAGCGVSVEDRTPHLLPRDASGIYSLTARIEQASPGVAIGNVVAVTSYGTFPMLPVGSGEWKAMLPLNQCVNGFDVRVEAPWAFLLAANTEREPALGVHQKWIDGPPPPSCNVQFGHLYLVNSTADLPDANPGDGTCATSLARVCTLRAAVMEANAHAGQDRIELGNSAYELTRDGSDDNALAGDLDITDEVAFTGEGAVIDAGMTGDRVFDISPGGVAIDVDLRGVTIQGGRADRGGAVRNRGRLHLFSARVRDNEVQSGGGGIYNDDGFIEMLDTHVAENVVTGNPGALGGGLLSDGERARVVIRASSFVNNESRQHGGAILVGGGRIEIRDSTLSGNRAEVHGGALFVNPSASGTLRNVTITLNVADADGSSGGDGGGIIHGGGTGALYIANSVIAANVDGVGGKDDCQGTLASTGFNLIGVGDNCGGLDANDLVGSQASPIDPKLGPLNQNINGTQQHVPSIGSPTLDAANPDPENDARTSRCTHVDQRGVLRPQGPIIDGRRRCDIGAVERQ